MAVYHGRAHEGFDSRFDGHPGLDVESCGTRLLELLSSTWPRSRIERMGQSWELLKIAVSNRDRSQRVPVQEPTDYCSGFV